MNAKEIKELLKVEFQGPTTIAEDTEGYIAFMDGIPGLLETGVTKEAAFEELMLSLKVKIAYDNGISLLPQKGYKGGAIAFAEWIIKNNYNSTLDNKWVNYARSRTTTTRTGGR